MRLAPAAPIVALALLASAAGAARAQTTSGSASLTARAVVVTSLSVVRGADLTMNLIPNGTAFTTAYSSAGAGRFDVTGTPNALVDLVFTALPASIAAGAQTITLAYTNQGCAGASSASCTVFSPTQSASTPSATVAIPAGGILYVFLGATATAPVGTPSGTYETTITLQAAYNGL